MSTEEGRRTEAFVDRIEGNVAVLRVDGATFELPAALLPDGAGEGTWIEIGVRAVEVPEDVQRAEAARRKLSADDDGGDFKL